MLPSLQDATNGLLLFAIVVLIACVVWAYRYAERRVRDGDAGHHPRWRSVSFYTGLFLMTVVFTSPFAMTGRGLLSLETIQHILLLQVTAPLLLLGRPTQLLLEVMPPGKRVAVLRFVVRKLKAYPFLYTLMTIGPILAFNGIIVGWHLPSTFSAAMEQPVTHWIMHVMFVMTALLFWWGILMPMHRQLHLRTVWTLVALVFTMIVNKIFGGMLLLADGAIYSFNAADRPWGMSALADQQVAGLILISFGIIFYGSLVFSILTRALLRSEKDQERRERMYGISRLPS